MRHAPHPSRPPLVFYLVVCMVLVTGLILIVDTICLQATGYGCAWPWLADDALIPNDVP